MDAPTRHRYLLVLGLVEPRTRAFRLRSESALAGVTRHGTHNQKTHGRKGPRALVSAIAAFRFRASSALAGVTRHLPGQHNQESHGGDGVGRPDLSRLADIIDDVSFETLGGDEQTMYVGIRRDGTMDLGVGNEGGATVHFSHRDVEKIEDAAFALWRQRGNDPVGDDDALFGLIDDTIVDTEGGRIYLAISEKLTRTADPDDEDDEDEFGPVLTVGIPTAEETEDNPDFHELDLDEDGFDNLIENLQRLRDDNPPAEVETEGAGPIDATLMADHTIQLVEGGVVSDPPTLRVGEADQLAGAIEKLLKVDLPDGDNEDPDVLDGEDINDDLGVSLMTDGTFSVMTPLGYSIEFDREDAELFAETLRRFVQQDRALPGGGGIPARSGTAQRSQRFGTYTRHRYLLALGLVTGSTNGVVRHTPGGVPHNQLTHGRGGTSPNFGRS